MKINKMTVTVDSSKDFRAQRLDGEAEGKGGKELRLKGNVTINKLKGLFNSADDYAAEIEAMYNEAGELVHTARGLTPILLEGRACKTRIEFALTDTHEFEDCTLDCLKYKLEKGGVAEFRARLRLFPDNKQTARIPAWLKNEIKLTLNGETISAEEADEEEPELPLGVPGDEEEGEQEDDNDPPAAGPGEVLPGVPAAHQDSAKALVAAGVIGVGTGNGGKKQPPSTAHGEVLVDGQKPPQRAPRRRPGETIQ